MKELSFIKDKKVVAYAKKSFVMVKMMKKINLDYAKKSEIIVIKPENLEELLMIFAI